MLLRTSVLLTVLVVACSKTSPDAPADVAVAAATDATAPTPSSEDAAPSANGDVTPDVTWPTAGPRLLPPSAPPDVVEGKPQLVGWVPRHDLPAITADGATVVHVEEDVVPGKGFTLELVWRKVADNTVARRLTFEHTALTAPPSAQLARWLAEANAALAKESLTPMPPLSRVADGGPELTTPGEGDAITAAIKGERLVLNDGTYTLYTSPPDWSAVTLPACAPDAPAPDCGCALTPSLVSAAWSPVHRVIYAGIQMDGYQCTSSLARHFATKVPALVAPFEVQQPPPHLLPPAALPAPMSDASYDFSGWPRSVGFPAISEDGATIVWLDGMEDWRAPIAMSVRRHDVVSDKPGESFTVLGREGDPDEPYPATYVPDIGKRVQELNTWLATTKWTPMVLLTRVEDPADEGTVPAHYVGKDPAITVTLVKSKLTVEIDGKKVYAKVDKRWSDRPARPCGDDPGEYEAGCDCEFDAGLYTVAFSPAQRVLWLMIDSSGYHGCDAPHHWVALKLPATK